MSFNTFFKIIDKFDPAQIVFIGLGNRQRSDDAAGLVFLEKLQKTDRFKSSTFITAGTNPENYLREILEVEPELVVFIDAFVSDGPAGEIRWLESDKIHTPDFSTHAFSIKLVEKFILNEHKNCEIRYIGIRPETLEWSTSISAPLRQSLDHFFNN